MINHRNYRTKDTKNWRVFRTYHLRTCSMRIDTTRQIKRRPENDPIHQLYGVYALKSFDIYILKPIQ